MWIKTLPQQIEIAFWNAFIRAATESNTARAVITGAYRFSTQKGLAVTIIQAAVLTVTGILIGFVLGYL